jgi:hypothetical protein
VAHRDELWKRRLTLTTDECWQFHAYDYAWRRSAAPHRALVKPVRPSPIDPEGVWFNEALVGQAAVIWPAVPKPEVSGQRVPPEEFERQMAGIYAVLSKKQERLKLPARVALAERTSALGSWKRVALPAPVADLDGERRWREMVDAGVTATEATRRLEAEAYPGDTP